MNEAERMLETMATLKGQLEAALSKADPFSIHVSASRRKYRLLDGAQIKRRGGGKLSLHTELSYSEARRLGYAGSIEDWARILYAGM